MIMSLEIGEDLRTVTEGQGELEMKGLESGTM